MIQNTTIFTYNQMIHNFESTSVPSERLFSAACYSLWDRQTPSISEKDEKANGDKPVRIP
jgi:hypothetical protein